MKKHNIILIFIIIFLTSTSVVFGVYLERELNMGSFFEKYDIEDYYNFTMSEDVKQVLKETWNSSGKYEYSVCLDGRYNNNFITDDINGELIKNVKIDSYDNILVSDKATQSITNCNTLVQLHSHPSGNCKFSGTDIEQFKDVYEKRGVLFNIVQCDENKFIVTSWQNFGRGMIYEI